MRPTNESLISDYMADLLVDIRCYKRDGYHAIARQKQHEYDTLKAAENVRVDKYGMPTAG